MHVLVKMSWNMAMDFQAVNELQRYARSALKTTMEITALRVQDIEVYFVILNILFEEGLLF